jgi:PAS domain S-box-containing protein
MSDPRHPTDPAINLRDRALARLTAGTPAPVRRSTTAEALAVLHQLASSPATAADALALLHELQVYQVEVDLQQEELRSSRLELEEALARQIAVYERAPFAYVIVDERGVLCAANGAASRLLGAPPDDLVGELLGSFLSAADTDALLALLARSAESGQAQSSALQVRSRSGTATAVQAVVDADSAPGRFLLALAPGTGSN